MEMLLITPAPEKESKQLISTAALQIATFLARALQPHMLRELSLMREFLEKLRTELQGVSEGMAKKTIQALPEDLRTAIMLREVDGMSYEEIAESMDCPIGTVRSRIFRAREAIDIKLKPLMEQ